MRDAAYGEGRFAHHRLGPCDGAAAARVRQGRHFITLEDETDIANLIIWPPLFDRQRRVILGAQMLACRGKVQAANGVIHVVAEHLMDQSDLVRRVGGRGVCNSCWKRR